MSGPEVAIVVHYQATKGKGEQVAALLARHAAATRAEPGNLDFVALRSFEDPDSFVLYERYAGPEAFEAHTASPHYEGIAVAQIRPLLKDRTVDFCQVVEPLEPESMIMARNRCYLPRTGHDHETRC